MAINTTAAAKRPTRGRHPQPAPPCGCTTDGARCATAHMLYTQHQAARAMSDAGTQTRLYREYAYHLRQASVTAGRAQWGGDAA